MSETYSDSDSDSEYPVDYSHAIPVYRFCRTPDCKRRVGAWLFFQEVNDMYPCENGWEPPETPLPAPYEIREIDGKGRGLVAIRDIKAKELIIRERPVIIMPRAISCRVYGTTPVNVVWLETEKRLLRLLYWLEQADREKFVQLRNCKSPEECGPLTGIARTNAFGIHFSASKPAEYYMAICLTMSLVNHSCVPNACYSPTEKDVTFSLFAEKDIAAGEEITIAYTSVHMSRAERQGELSQKYRFTCTCPLCSRSDAESAASDDRRRFIRETARAVSSGRMIKNWVECPRNRKNAQTERDVETIEKLLRAMDIEGFDKGKVKAVMHCVTIFGASADLKNFKKWARKVLNYDVEEREEVEGWIRNPRSFPMWDDLNTNPIPTTTPITVVSPEEFLRMMDDM